MSFGAKLRALREEKKLTQTELAKELGVTLKTISNYETKNLKPRSEEMYLKIADFFDIDVNYLLTIEDNLALNFKEKFGSSAWRDADKLAKNLSSLFAGGDLPEEDKDKLFNSIAEAYYVAKMVNKKYGNRKR